MLSIDFKARLKNKTFWISIISAVLLLSQQLGLDFSEFIPGNYVNIINTIFMILTMLGITVDTSTPGVSDKTISNISEEQTSDLGDNKQIEQETELDIGKNNSVSTGDQELAQITQTDNTTAAPSLGTALPEDEPTIASIDSEIKDDVNSLDKGTITVDTNASSKVTADNLDNIPGVGSTVDSTSAASPN